jgi:hypothetical protein
MNFYLCIKVSTEESIQMTIAPFLSDGDNTEILGNIIPPGKVTNDHPSVVISDTKKGVTKWTNSTTS